MRGNDENTQQEQMENRLAGDIAKTRAGLFEWLLGERDESATINRLNIDYAYRMRSGSFRIGLMKIDGEYDTLYAEGLLELRWRAAELLRELMQPLCYDCEVLFTQSTGKMLLNYPGGNRKEVMAALRGVLEAMEIRGRFYRGTEFTVALGREAELPGGLWASAYEADMTLAQRLFGGVGTLMEPMDLALHPDERDALIGNRVPALEYGLQQRDAAIVGKVLDTLEADAMEAAPLTGKDLQLLAQEMLDLWLMMCKRQGIELLGGEGLEDDFQDHADLCGSAGRLFRCLKTVVLGEMDEWPTIKTDDTSK